MGLPADGCELREIGTMHLNYLMTKIFRAWYNRDCAFLSKMPAEGNRHDYFSLHYNYDAEWFIISGAPNPIKILIYQSKYYSQGTTAVVAAMAIAGCAVAVKHLRRI